MGGQQRREVVSGHSPQVSDRADLSAQQQAALRALESNWGECSELTVWEGGVNRPRITLNSLERRGLVRRVHWIDDFHGYMYELAGGAS